jgi:hypothetical protein
MDLQNVILFLGSTLLLLFVIVASFIFISSLLSPKQSGSYQKLDKKQNKTNLVTYNKCDHEFVLYNKYLKSDGDSGSKIIFEFICKNCRQEYTMYGKDLQNMLDYYKNKEQKEIACGINRELEESRIRIIDDNGHPHIFSKEIIHKGKYVTQVIDFYKSKGFDITDKNLEFEFD